MSLIAHALESVLKKINFSPTIMIVHRGNDTGSTEEPLALELEHVHWELADEPTRLDIPSVSAPVRVITTQPPVDDVTVKLPAINLKIVPITQEDASFLLDSSSSAPQQHKAPVHQIQDYRDQDSAKIQAETVTLHKLHSIISYRDTQNELDLNALCLKAVQRFQKKSGVLPTHVIVNTLRLMSERAEYEWETFSLPTMFGEMPISLRGMKDCPYNTARCIMEQGVRVA